MTMVMLMVCVMSYCSEATYNAELDAFKEKTSTLLATYATQKEGASAADKTKIEAKEEAARKALANFERVTKSKIRLIKMKEINAEFSRACEKLIETRNSQINKKTSNKKKVELSKKYKADRAKLLAERDAKLAALE